MKETFALCLWAFVVRLPAPAPASGDLKGAKWPVIWVSLSFSDSFCSVFPLPSNDKLQIQHTLYEMTLCGGEVCAGCWLPRSRYIHKDLCKKGLSNEMLDVVQERTFLFYISSAPSNNNALPPMNTLALSFLDPIALQRTHIGL